MSLGPLVSWLIDCLFDSYTERHSFGGIRGAISSGCSPHLSKDWTPGSSPYNEGAIFDLLFRWRSQTCVSVDREKRFNKFCLTAGWGRPRGKSYGTSEDSQDKLEIRKVVLDSPFDKMKVETSESWIDRFQRPDFSWRILRACTGGPLLMIHQRRHSCAKNRAWYILVLRSILKSVCNHFNSDNNISQCVIGLPGSTWLFQYWWRQSVF